MPPELLLQAIRELYADNQRLRMLLREAEAQVRMAEAAAQTFADLLSAHTPYEIIIPESEVYPCEISSVPPSPKPPSAT